MGRSSVCLVSSFIVRPFYLPPHSVERFTASYVSTASGIPLSQRERSAGNLGESSRFCLHDQTLLPVSPLVSVLGTLKNPKQNGRGPRPLSPPSPVRRQQNKGGERLVSVVVVLISRRCIARSFKMRNGHRAARSASCRTEFDSKLPERQL